MAGTEAPAIAGRGPRSPAIRPSIGIPGIGGAADRAACREIWSRFDGAQLPLWLVPLQPASGRRRLPRDRLPGLTAGIFITSPTILSPHFTRPRVQAVPSYPMAIEFTLAQIVRMTKHLEEIVPIAQPLSANVDPAEPPAPRTAGPRVPPPPPSPPLAQDGQDSEFLRGRRRSWARLIARTWHEDPSLCNSCRRPMEIIAALSSPQQDDVIERSNVSCVTSLYGTLPG
jgi:hypothetical protein